ncbi:MAG: GNAT family N-acetyltransferase [Oscillospiraceae bacterium]
MIRIATKNDTTYIKSTWSTCFDDTEKFVDWNFSRNYSPENTVVMDINGIIPSNMQIIPYLIQVGGFSYNAGYVSGLATMPHFRGRGYARDLFGYAFPLMLSRNMDISILIPFNFDFYERFGYTCCYDKPKLSCEIPEKDIPRLPHNMHNIPILNEIYMREMSSKNGYVLRSKKDWELILSDLFENSNGDVYIHTSDNGSIDGYAIYANKKPYEICGKPPFSIVESTPKPFAMARILNVKSVLKNLSKSYNGDIRIKILDEQIESNNLILRIFNKTITISDDFDIEVDIKTLTQSIMGYASGTENYSLFKSTNNYVNLLL